jgi:beta-lactamase regulating signal transducer with metallopeptidase domain
MTELLLLLLLNGLVLGTLLLSAALLLVALLRWPLRRLAGAQAQYQLWLLVPAVLLAAGLAALQPQRPLRWQIDLPEADWSAPLTAVVEPVAAAAPLAEPSVPLLPLLLLGAWLLGALVCAAVWSQGQRRLLRAPRLAAGGSAALVGAWRPRLRLPTDFRSRFPAPERRLILLHERLHAERGDTRWLLLALSLLALQWFNPLAWWALRRLRADMELACDAALLRRHPGQLKRYRQALLRAEGFAARLPLSATPCSSHPLFERLSMLPLHSLQTPRRWCVTALIAVSAGFAYAAKPAVTPAVPAVSTLQVAAAPAAPSAATPVLPAAAPKPAPARPSPKAKAPPAVPALTALTPPANAAPPPSQPLLRTDVKLTIGGQALEEVVLLEAFDKSSKRRFTMPNGQELELELRGLPADETRFPKDSIQMTIGVVNLSTGEVLAKPRLVTGNGIEASVERSVARKDGQPDQDAIRIDLLARKVHSAEPDAEAARASLMRDIEAGRAPAPFKR